MQNKKDKDSNIKFSKNDSEYDIEKNSLNTNPENNNSKEYIVLTEPGIIHQMQQRMPEKQFIEVPGMDGCSCNACPFMRLNTLEKLEECLSNMNPQIELDSELIQRAIIPIERMLKMSK